MKRIKPATRRELDLTLTEAYRALLDDSLAEKAFVRIGAVLARMRAFKGARGKRRPVRR